VLKRENEMAPTTTDRSLQGNYRQGGRMNFGLLAFGLDRPSVPLR
jgi:hypothetical protein